METLVNNFQENEEARSLSSIAATHLRTKLEPKMKVEEADTTLRNLIAEGWLDENEGKVSLSVRSYMELREHFQGDGAYASFNTGFQ